MKNEGKSAVLMLARSRLYYFDGSLVHPLDLPPAVVNDLDIKDRDALFTLVTNFIQASKLLPSQIYFVLSESVCFTKDFTVGAKDNPESTEAMITEYTESIPFAAVVSKVYKTTTTWRVVGANQDLIDTILEAFEARGFGLSALIPANIFSDLAASTDLTSQKAQLVLSKKEFAVKSSMVGEREAKDQVLSTTQTAVPKNKILPYLVGVFGLLIIVLIFMVVMRFK